MGNAMAALKTAEDVKAVSAELARNTKTNLFRCLWAMQFESALRFGDAIKLTWDQFAEGKTHLSIKQEKTGKLHKVAITPAMRSIVQARRKRQQTAQNQVSTYSALLEEFSLGEDW